MSDFNSDPEGPLYTCDLSEESSFDDVELYPLNELIPVYHINEKRCYLICEAEFSQIDWHYFKTPNVSHILAAIQQKQENPYYKCDMEPHGQYDSYFVPPEQLTLSKCGKWYCTQCSDYSDLDLDGVEFTDLTFDKILQQRQATATAQ